MPDEQELTPRTYADLLALLETARVWAPPGPAGAEAGGAGGETTSSAVVLPSGQTVDMDLFVEQQIADALQIDVLGKTEENEIEIYSSFSKSTVRIKGLSRMKYADLITHLSTPVKRVVLKTSADEVPGMYSLRDVIEAIGHLASKKTLSDESKLGPGCWPILDVTGKEQQAVVLVNSSEAMHFNGHVERITHPRHRGQLLSFESGSPPWYDYDEMTAMLEAVKGQKFRDKVCDDLVNLFGRWRWRGKKDPLVCAGLTLATWVQTVWAWRPRIDVLGASNTGKSYLCSALAGMFRDLVILTSDTTAAGLRQTIKNSARVVIVDEVDAKNKSKVARQREILEMLRSASRGTAAIRGSGSGKAMEFTLRHLVWVAGISLTYDDAADRNRAVILNLLPPTQEMAGKLRLPTPDELHSLGQRGLATALWACQEARCAAVALKDEKIDGVDQRLVESYAVPAAMMAAVMGMDRLAAAGILRTMLSEAQNDIQLEPDETNLVADILGATINLQTYRMTVGQVIEHVMDPTASNRDDWRKVLEAGGIRLDMGAKPRIMLSYQLVRRRLLYGTRWAEQAIDQYLRRIDGCESDFQRIGGSRGRCCSFSLGDFVFRFIGKADDQELPNLTEQEAF